MHPWGSGYKSLRQWIYRGWAPCKVHCMVPGIITIFSSLPCQLAQSTSCMAVWSPESSQRTPSTSSYQGPSIHHCQVSVSIFVKCRPIFMSPLQHGNNEGEVYSWASYILRRPQQSRVRICSVMAPLRLKGVSLVSPEAAGETWV